MPGAESADIERLTAVLRVAKEHGLRVSAVSVGDIRLVIASIELDASQPLTESQRADAELREASRRTFGKILPPDLLRQYREDGLL